METAMNQAQRISYPWAEALAAGFAAAARRIGAAIAASAEARGRAIAVRQLQQLSDRSLRDIGLERSGIHAAVYGKRR
jgi:uncharacterized protein YjiS (DUF1127 family)